MVQTSISGQIGSSRAVFTSWWSAARGRWGVTELPWRTRVSGARVAFTRDYRRKTTKCKSPGLFFHYAWSFRTFHINASLPTSFIPFFISHNVDKLWCMWNTLENGHICECFEDAVSNTPGLYCECCAAEVARFDTFVTWS